MEEGEEMKVSSMLAAMVVLVAALWLGGMAQADIPVTQEALRQTISSVTVKGKAIVEIRLAI